MKSSAHAPAVIAALRDQVHFLPFVLSHVTGPKLARLAIETHAPDVAQAVGPNLRAHAFRFCVKRVLLGLAVLVLAHERIVLRNAVGKFARARVHIKAENLSEQMMPALTDEMGITAQPAIARAHVQVAVRAKG